MRQLLVLVVLIASFGGCADGDPGISIQGNFAPDDPCTYGGDPGTASLFFGTYDLAIQRGYQFGGLIQNQMVSNDTDLDQNKNDFFVEGYEVELKRLNGERIELGDGTTNPYTITVSGFVPSAASTGSSGFGSAAAFIIPEDYVGVLADFLGASPSPADIVSINVELKVFGETLGGLSTTSRPYNYTIRLCVGCLASCSEDPDENTDRNMHCLAGQDDGLYCPTAL